MKRYLLVTLILSLMLTTGCWDMIELNQRIFPYSAGIDLSYQDKGRFNITFSYPNINAIGKNATQKDRVHIVTTNGDDIFEAGHNLTSRLQYPIYYKHLKVLLLSEEVAKNEKYVKEIVDGINRDFIMNKTVLISVVKGDAKDLLHTIPNASRQEVVEGTLYSLLNNQQNSSKFTPKRLSDFIKDFDDDAASILPVVFSKTDEIEFSGGAIFKNYKLVGYIDHDENKAIAILNDDLKEDGFDIDFRDIDLSILATGFKSKMKLEESENLKINYSIEIEGQIHEYTLPDGIKIDSEEILKGMEDTLASDIETNLNKIIQKLQKEYKTDVIKVADYLKKYHSKLWIQLEDNWDEVFSQADITAKVVVKIRRRGLTK